MSDEYELHLKVVGVTFEGRQDVLAWMDCCREWFARWGSVRLQPEPDNEFDANAIQVLAVSSAGDHQCGYVPRVKTAPVHKLLEAGAVEGRVLKLDSVEVWPEDGAPEPEDVWYLRIAVRCIGGESMHCGVNIWPCSDVGGIEYMLRRVWEKHEPRGLPYGSADDEWDDLH